MNGDQELVTVLAVCGVAALAAFINGYVLLVILLTKRVRSFYSVLKLPTLLSFIYIYINACVCVIYLNTTNNFVILWSHDLYFSISSIDENRNFLIIPYCIPSIRYVLHIIILLSIWKKNVLKIKNLHYSILYSNSNCFFLFLKKELNQLHASKYF